MSSRGILANVVGPVAALAIIVGIAALLGSYAQYVLALVIVHCLIGTALVMIVGYARVIMLAAGAMLAIGAYGSTISITRA
jgi:hypothetical protein